MDKKEELKRIFNRYTQSNPIFIKSLDDDHTLENSMKESLNRTGDLPNEGEISEEAELHSTSDGTADGS